MQAEEPANPEPADHLRLSYRHDGQVTVVEVDGEVDVFTCPLLRELLLDLVDQGCRHVVVSLERAAFIDAAGLGVLAGAWYRLQVTEGRLLLVSPPAHIRRVLDVAGLRTEVSRFTRIWSRRWRLSGREPDAVCEPSEAGTAGRSLPDLLIS